MELTGKILFIGETNNVSKTDKPFDVRSFAIQMESENNGMVYQNNVGFQASGILCERLDNVNIDDTVKVVFGVTGTLKSKKDTVAPTEKNPEAYECYTNLRVGRIEIVAKAGQSGPAQTTEPAKTTSTSTATSPAATATDADDLPF